MDGVESSGVSHEELSGDVNFVLQGLGDVDDPSALTSMSVAGMVTLARNVRVVLKGRMMSAEERVGLVKEGAQSALVAGIVHTVIG
jgi:hypothetical protein